MTDVDLLAVDVNAVAAELDIPIDDAMQAIRAVQRHSQSALLDAVHAIEQTGFPIERLAECLKIVGEYREHFREFGVASNNAHVMARTMALMQGTIDPQAPDYLPRTAAEADDFFPEAWAIAAIETSLKWADRKAAPQTVVSVDRSESEPLSGPRP